MNSFLAWNKVTALFFVKGKGFVGKADEATVLSRIELSVVKITFENVSFASL